MGYLLPAEYEAYGLAAETADALVTMASALIDGHCRRATLESAEYTERLRVRPGGQTVRLSYGPVQALVKVRVRFSTGRRGEAGDLFGGEAAGLTIATAFGLPGTWSELDVTRVDVYAQARELMLPMNLLGLAYNEAEVVYRAGFDTVPEPVKAACAQLVRNAEATPALNVKRGRLDTMQMEYFGPTLLDDTVRTLLRPYVAERL